MSLLNHELSLKAHEWRARISNGLSDSEQQEFSNWMADHPAHGEAFAEAEVMWGAVGRMDLSHVKATYAEEDVQPQRIPEPWMATLSSYGSRFGGKLAAGLMTLVAAAALWFAIDPPFGSQHDAPDRTRFASTAIAAKMITLTDGSTIRLDSGSELFVTYSLEERLVELAKGEAFYVVRSDAERPFTVQTPFADVEVTGTRFSTELRDGGVEVTVAEGSVDIFARVGIGGDSSQSTRYALTAGEAIWTSDGIDLAKLHSPDQAATASSRGEESSSVPLSIRKTYRNAALSEVVRDMNRHTTSPISVAPEATDIKLTGTFDIADTEALLATIDAALPVVVVRGEAGTTLAPE